MWEDNLGPILSHVPSVASLKLPLHGVPDPHNRYSTIDPIQELKGILQTKDLDPDRIDDLEIGRAL